jgi:hypothetical protein
MAVVTSVQLRRNYNNWVFNLRTKKDGKWVGSSFKIIAIDANQIM